MTPTCRLWISVAAVLLPLLALWLAGDAFYAHRTRVRSQAPGVRRASILPLTLNPSGSPALLLVHGFADGPSVFATLAPLLAHAGFAVHAMHLSGSGIPATEMEGICLSIWRADIDREISALRAQNPRRPIWLVGHSLGGALVFDAALREANSVAGLILLAPLIEPSNARSPLLTSRQWFAILSRALLFSKIVESRLPADLHDPTVRAQYRTDRFIHRDIYRALFATIHAIVHRATDWHGPLLMVVSPSDQIVDTDSSTHFFSSATNASPAKLVEHPSGGHVLPLDTANEIIASQMAQFILTVPKTESSDDNSASDQPDHRPSA